MEWSARQDAARELARDYDWDAVAEALEEVYRAALAAAPPTPRQIRPPVRAAVTTAAAAPAAPAPTSRDRLARLSAACVPRGQRHGAGGRRPRRGRPPRRPVRDRPRVRRSDRAGPARRVRRALPAPGRRRTASAARASCRCRCCCTPRSAASPVSTSSSGKLLALATMVAVCAVHVPCAAPQRLPAPAVGRPGRRRAHQLDRAAGARPACAATACRCCCSCSRSSPPLSSSTSPRSTWLAAALAALAVTAKLHARLGRRRHRRLALDHRPTVGAACTSSAAYVGITVALLADARPRVTRGRLLENVFGLSGAGLTSPADVLTAPYRLLQLLVSDALGAWVLCLPVALRRSSGSPCAAGPWIPGSCPWSRHCRDPRRPRRHRHRCQPAARRDRPQRRSWWGRRGGSPRTGVPLAPDGAGGRRRLARRVRTGRHHRARGSGHGRHAPGREPLPTRSAGRRRRRVDDRPVRGPVRPGVTRPGPRRPRPVHAAADRAGRPGRASSGWSTASRRSDFDLVVLVESLDNEPWWADYHFGTEVISAVDRSYVRTERVQGYDVYRPRPPDRARGAVSPRTRTGRAKRQRASDSASAAQARASGVQPSSR